ncbi:OmpA family protein [Candidatus Thioglobus sp.]|uniref:OmpA family protein n=2 Tax=Candidatus Thioglobus sp. TaxID=2026721 RepID=UPI003D146CF1
MLKITSLITTAVLLSSCSIFEKPDQEIEVKKPGVVIVEDRTDNANESIASLDSSHFKAQHYEGNYTRSNAENNALMAVVNEFQNSGVKFILYFSYDGSEINEAATQEIIKHANFMRDNPMVNLRLEGHADERGTREYNLALGENRALAVKEVLGLYDLASRTEVISFGEENPIMQLHNESAWQKNRRVEFIYQ